MSRQVTRQYTRLLNKALAASATSSQPGVHRDNIEACRTANRTIMQFLQESGHVNLTE